MVRRGGDYGNHFRGLGSRAVSLQIAKLILYSRAGDVRELAFRLGALNVLTGASKTGKSAIIDIVDYCTGRSECNVADGVIRRYVGWYAVLFQLNESQIFIARRNPVIGERTNGDVYMERAARIETPPASALAKNTTVSAVEKFLAAAIGISENEHRPPVPTRDSLEANFRHALLFSFQDQNDIDSRRRLFHRQGEDFIGQAIRDTLPYFLGAIDEDRLLKQAQLDQARRELRQLERQLRDAESLDSSAHPRAQALLDEAKHVGLVDERTVAAGYEGIFAILRRIARDTGVRADVVMVDGEDVLASLRTERQGLRSELERVNAEIRSTRTFTSETNGYEREAKEQRARLSAVGLINTGGHSGVCPLCESQLANPTPTITEIERSLQDLGEQLAAVEAENPRLQLRLAALLREEAALQERLRGNQQRIAARIQENEILRAQQEIFILQARTIGKVSQYVETASSTDSSSSLSRAIEAGRAKVAVLDRELDPEAIRDKVSAFVNIIGRYMTTYSDTLELEHRASPLRLDIRELTVVADTLDGPVPLFRMGSGENWVGYHVLAHLALHKWFRQKQRPVPGFLILDQPSQAHYPAERDADGSLDVLADEDRRAVLQLFELIASVATELAPELQIIVMDHADLNLEWWETAVVERWRKGQKLVPNAWVG
jgi:transcription initiation factor IIE alpha subunit